MDPSTRIRLRGLPKESSPRVLLAVLAFVFGSIVVGEAVWYTVYLDGETRVIARCRQVADDPPGFLACERPTEHDRILWTLAWGPAALGLAVAGAAAGSRWRRRKLTPFPLERLPTIDELSAQAARAVELEPTPPLLWRPARPIAMAQRRRLREVVRGDRAGAAEPFDERAGAAGATFRHEDAHVKLRDVAPSRIMLWSGPVGVVVLVAFLVGAWDTGFDTVVSALWRLALVVVVIVATRASVLRAHEFDADLCAAASIRTVCSRRWPVPSPR